MNATAVRVRSLLLPLLSAWACSAPAAAPRPAADPAAAPTSSALLAVERAVFQEINRARQAHGLPALRRIDQLDRAARDHAHELAGRGLLDHNSTNPSRRSPGLRASAAGFAWTGIAENLAATSGSGESVPARTATMWLDSPGHRSNMLSARYTHTGVGIALDRRGVWYITQLYALPLGSR